MQEQIFSLNTLQGKKFDIICDGARHKVIFMDLEAYTIPQTPNLFVNGGAGVCKSHLVNTVRLFLKLKALIILEQQKSQKFWY